MLSFSCAELRYNRLGNDTVTLNIPIFCYIMIHYDNHTKTFMHKLVLHNYYITTQTSITQTRKKIIRRKTMYVL